MKQWRLLFVGVLVGLSLPFSTKAFEIRPAIQDLRLEAGGSVEREIQVMNPSDEPIELFFTVQKIRPAGGGAPEFLSPSDTSDLPEWIRVSAPSVRLAPRASERIQVRILVPAEAPTGGHAVAIFATESPVDGATVEIAKRIATLWFVAVQGKDGVIAEPVWRLRDLSLEQVGSWKPRGVRVTTGLQNGGTVHGIALASLSLKGIFTAATSTTLAARLLPSEERVMIQEIEVSAPIDRITAVARLPSGEMLERSIWIVSYIWLSVAAMVLVGLSVLFWWRKGGRRGILVS